MTNTHHVIAAIYLLCMSGTLQLLNGWLLMEDKPKGWGE